MAERFNIKDLGIAEKFLGMEIEYGEDGSVKLHQEGYLYNLLKRHGMQDCNPISTPLDTSIKLTKATDTELLRMENPTWSQRHDCYEPGVTALRETNLNPMNSQPQHSGCGGASVT